MTENFQPAGASWALEVDGKIELAMAKIATAYLIRDGVFIF